ncbi:DUF3656 domain-containing protein [Intestinibacillus massiliensis]|nr:DUF3656 domain-containing protein [Intestinibacillus massiliensis]
MNGIELLSPAGSMEGVRAAVQSGADAVYMGFGTFNARRGAKNFTAEEMAAAISYCRARGVKTNITFNIVALDREREDALADARFLYEAGADALIVQDLGLARLLRAHAPGLPLHASTQMTVHTVEGAKAAKALGFTRVVLARECTLEEIRRITAEAGVETEVFVHGALCMCYSGQCYLSGVIGQRSGNRGLCAQPCRLPYGYGQKDGKCYPLSLKDLSLAGWLGELRAAGVASLKIEGRMKRPEYAAAVTKVYADLLREGRKPTKEEQNILQTVFSRDGFTDGYLTGRKGDAMFGTKTEVPLQEAQPLYDAAARRFAEGKEAPLVPVTLSCAVSPEGITVTAEDGARSATAADRSPVEAAKNRPSTPEMVEKALRKTGGTPFAVQETRIDLPGGLMVPAARLNALRREALDKLMAQRGAPPSRPPWRTDAPADRPARQADFAGYTVEVRELAQATDALLEAAPAALYAPLTALAADPARTAALASRVPVAAVLPRIYRDGERADIRAMLETVRGAGVPAALAGNIGQIAPLKGLGFAVYGDFGLNATNSDTLQALADMGVQRQTLSFELRLAQLRDLHKPMEAELIVYGYLPLMVFENCAIRRKTGKCTCKSAPCTLVDRTGRAFRLLPEYGCRNTLLNSQPLCLETRAEYASAGAAYARLRFTTESPARCAEVARGFAQGTPPACPEGATRGLYFRGVN